MYPGLYARTKPNEPAAIAASSGERLTWRELDARSNQLAQLLHAMGLRRGDNFAVMLENHLRYFEVAWAALRSGLYVTAVNRYLTTEEAGYIVNDCGARLLVTSKRMAAAAEGLQAHAPRCERWLMIDGVEPGYESYEEAIGGYRAEPFREEPGGGFMLYSSGTTGRPKGIKRPLPEGSVRDEPVLPIVALMKELWGFSAETVYLSPAPLYHSAPLAFTTMAQSLGGTVIMMERFDAHGALEYIERYGVTHSQWVPTMFSRMLKLPEADRTKPDLTTHRCAIHAAAPCPRKVKEAMLDWWGPMIYEYYGGTELNGFTHVGPEDWLGHPGTVGRALIGTIRICDDAGDELPAGETGLIYFEQEEMPFEYYNDPEKTRAAQHPHHPGWSALGDVGYVDEDRFLYLTDRQSFMIISGGANIYPQEVEDALILHPKVADAAVIGVPDEDMGEAVKAVVQPMAGIEPGPALEAELIEYTRDQLAHYKCPQSVDFEATLPRLPTGKLYKRLLKDRYWGNKDSRIV